MLRLGLSIFLLMSALDKIIAPEFAQRFFSDVFSLNLSFSVVMLIGSCQLVLSLLFMLGFSKRVTYGFGAVYQIFATAAHYRQLAAPFEGNLLYVSAIPILFAFIALFLMRDLDTLWTLAKKKFLFAR